MIISFSDSFPVNEQPKISGTATTSARAAEVKQLWTQGEDDLLYATRIAALEEFHLPAEANRKSMPCPIFHLYCFRAFSEQESPIHRPMSNTPLELMLEME